MTAALQVYAHSRPGEASATWEPLAGHLSDVANLCRHIAEPFEHGPLGFAAGALHDIGKASAPFQAYIRGEGASLDHSTAGARVAAERFGALGRVLAFAIAGHHVGLPDGAGHEGGSLEQRLDGKRRTIPDAKGWEAHAPPLPDMQGVRPPRRGPELGFERAFLTRMIFSALIDADRLATERFYHGEVERGGGPLDPPPLLARMEAHLEAKPRAGTMNQLRSDVLAHAKARAALPPGLFPLTVPTGGGKTLTSLAFALTHALTHGLRRVVYVIPYTSIIEQTAAVFSDVIGVDAVLEHHASFDWDAPRGVDDEGREGRAKLQRAAQN